MHRKTYHICGLGHIVLLRCQYYPKRSRDLMQSISKSQEAFSFFCRNRNIHPKMHIKSHGISKTKIIVKKKYKVGSLMLPNFEI